MGLNTSISFFSALISWVLAIFLVMQLLSGTFDERTCQTTCVAILFWTSFAVAVIGLIFSAIGILFSRPKGTRPGLIGILSALALLGLCGIYVTTMLIGTFGI